MGINAEIEFICNTHIGARTNMDAVAQYIQVVLMVATFQIGDAAIVNIAEAIINAKAHATIDRGAIEITYAIVLNEDVGNRS